MASGENEEVPAECQGTRTFSKDFGLHGMQELRKLPYLPVLRINPVEHSREGDDFADMLGARNPGDGAFEAEAKAGVRDAAIAAEVQIPLEGFDW